MLCRWTARRVVAPMVAVAWACSPPGAAPPRPPALQPQPAATAPPAPEPPATADIATVHRARCGACHVRVEPGKRRRDALALSLARHRKRVHLSEAQWSALLDYLAPEGPRDGSAG